MATGLKGRSLASIRDLSKDEIEEILQLAAVMKKEVKNGKYRTSLKNKVLAMIFQKPSTRTRVSFEVGIYQLGGTAIYLSSQDIQLRRGETIADTARTLSRYCDCIMARVFSHQDILDLIKNASVPVINGLSDITHPCQSLADLLTIRENKGDFSGLKFAYIGDGNNMLNSLLLACAKVGITACAATPEGFEPDAEYVKLAKEYAKESGAEIEITRDSSAAVKEADIIYTDVWASMGQESEHEKRVRIFKDYQINSKLVQAAKKNHIIMHCLPAHRGEEISA
ncbi:MAG: ornithine carbamoyltransferase, partial [Planctomycetota bacterium]